MGQDWGCACAAVAVRQSLSKKVARKMRTSNRRAVRDPVEPKLAISISIYSDRAKKCEIRFLCMYVDTLRIDFLARVSCPGSMVSFLAGATVVAAMLDI